MAQLRFKAFASSLLAGALLNTTPLYASDANTSEAATSPAADTSSLHFKPEASLSFPQPLRLGAQMECPASIPLCLDHALFIGNLGYFRYPISSSNKSLTIISFEAGNRLFPFTRTAPALKNFYFSFLLGYRRIDFSSSEISAFKVNDEVLVTLASLLMNTIYISPSVGFEYQLSDRITAGSEVGVELALFGRGSIYLENSNTGDTSDNSTLLSLPTNGALNRVARLLAPRITFFRLTLNL